MVYYDLDIEKPKIDKIGDDYFYENHKLDCEFFESNHTYWLGYWEGEDFYKVKQLVSVTTIMKKYNLVSGYGKIPAYRLQKKAEYGSFVHKELEEYIKYNKAGFSNELSLFIQKSLEQDIIPEKSEFIVFNDVVAGTVDLQCKMNGFDCKADFKTTAKYDENYLSWQLSIYNYLDKNKAEKIYCFHFINDDLKIIPVPFKTDAEIEEIFEKERNL